MYRITFLSLSHVLVGFLFQVVVVFVFFPFLSIAVALSIYFQLSFGLSLSDGIRTAPRLHLAKLARSLRR